MIRILICLLFLVFSLPVFSQPGIEKIKVVLFGTFHFGETTDRNKTAFSDLFSEKRQSEIDTMIKAISSLNINKYFLEFDYSKQEKLDSLYGMYKNHLLTTEKQLSNEIIQVVFKANIENEVPMIAADFKQELPYSEMMEYDEKHKNELYPYSFFEIPSPFLVKRKPLKDCTLSEYYIQLNNAYSIQIIMYDYLHYALSYGTGKNYVGENLTKVWYDRNLKIFTNILRSIDIKKDKTIFVLFGSAHTAVLRQFFENHPMFEIIELETFLKK